MKVRFGGLLLVFFSVVLPISAQVTGSGTTDYIPKWTSKTALGDSKLFQTGGHVGVGTTSPAWPLDVSGNINTSAGYKIEGATVLDLPGGSTLMNVAVGPNALAKNAGGSQNTAIGNSALFFNTDGTENTAIGAFALGGTVGGVGNSNTALGTFALMSNRDGGLFNTASGDRAMLSNLTGSGNTASGFVALSSNTTGNSNTALGSGALASNVDGNSNTASGDNALLNNTGSNNTASGFEALSNNTSGANNIAIGVSAASSVSGLNSNNIHIGSTGSSADNGAIRIGTSGIQTSFFVAAVSGVTTGNQNAVPVVIDSNGQLGTISSSRRYKTDIQDMGEASQDLMRLRPVTFRYEKPFADGSRPLQYGLIAEEVEEVNPDLVARSADGQIETVKYQLLDPMLLNEVQRQQAEIRDLQERLKKMEAVLAERSHTPEVQ